MNFTRWITALTLFFVYGVNATVQEPDPNGTTVIEAFNFIVGGDAASNVRYLIVGATFAIALSVMAYALKDSFEAMAEGQISKKSWAIYLVRVLVLLTLLNILLTL